MANYSLGFIANLILEKKVQKSKNCFYRSLGAKHRTVMFRNLGVLNFVNTLLARDSLFLRQEMKKVTPDIDLTQEIDIEGEAVKVTIPMTANFFWPSADI